MAAPAATTALQQALTNMGNEAHAAAGAVGAFAAAGGQPAAHVAAAVTAAVAPLTASIATMQGQMHAMQGQMTTMQGQMHTVQGDIMVLRSMTARAWNGTCGDGITRPYEPVPNNAGVTAPPGLPAVRNVTQLLALTGPQLTAWCNLYGAPAAAGRASRRAQLAALLGVPLPPL